MNSITARKRKRSRTVSSSGQAATLEDLARGERVAFDLHVDERTGRVTPAMAARSILLIDVRGDNGQMMLARTDSGPSGSLGENAK